MKIDIEEFNRKAQHIIDTVVKPQVQKWERAKAIEEATVNPNMEKKKRLTRAQKEEQMVPDMINKMFEIAGHRVTYDDIKDRKDAWYAQWTMTEQQYDEWELWGKKYLMKNLRMYAKMAERQMSMVGLMWGLKFDKAPGTDNTNVTL